MRWFIVVGGISVILSVLGLFVFIFWHAIPLFQKARVGTPSELGVSLVDPVAMLPGSYGFDAVVVQENGAFQFLSCLPFQESVTIELAESGPHEVVEVSTHQGDGYLYLGMRHGAVLTVRTAFLPHAQESHQPVIEILESLQLPVAEGAALLSLDTYHMDQQELIIGLVDSPGEGQILGINRSARANPFGEVETRDEHEWSLILPDGVVAKTVLSGADARSIVVLSEQGELFYFRTGSGSPELRQRFFPMGDQGPAEMAFLNGRRTLAVWTPGGRVRFFTPVSLAAGGFKYVQSNETFFEGTGPLQLVPAADKRSLLLVRGNRVGLHYSTTNALRWEGSLPFVPQKSQFGELNQSILFLNHEGSFVSYPLDDPFPEAGLRGLFGKVHYEGREASSYEWQSTGASDRFEPKISLIPLLFGSIKGTLCSLLISIPIALCAAVYSAQFIRREWKAWIRPTIELMASIPSVILGLLAAIWFGPLVVNKVPSMLSFMVLVPMGAMLAGFAWGRLSPVVRKWIPDGTELFLLVPLFFALSYTAWHLGDWVESIFFRVYDLPTGEWVGDFALWWSLAEGKQMEQRNSFIIGVFMGFAVVPLIFSVAEEAFSSVPRQLVSGSIALGASRWQTVRRVIIPMAASGILSAIMIGMGRAIGETMIVLMASGNTPILEWNFMAGFRALSANIAIELPEATQGGLLYRSMFLGASLLFVLTFFVNTLADLLRGHLRKKYKVLE